MLGKIIGFSLSHKLIIILLTIAVIIVGAYSLTQIPIGMVPDSAKNGNNDVREPPRGSYKRIGLSSV